MSSCCSTVFADRLPDRAPLGLKERLLLLGSLKKRGISHGDMIDLNKENIPGFDVRKFYVTLVAELKERGL